MEIKNNPPGQGPTGWGIEYEQAVNLKFPVPDLCTVGGNPTVHQTGGFWAFDLYNELSTTAVSISLKRLGALKP